MLTNQEIHPSKVIAKLPSRLWGYGTLILALSLGVWLNFFPFFLIWAVLAIIVYVAISEMASRQWGVNNPTIVLITSVLDAGSYGFIFNAIGFNVVPTTCLMIMLIATLISMGNFKTLIYGFISMVTGIFISIHFLGVEINDLHSLAVDFICGIGVCIYFGITSQKLFDAHEKVSVAVSDRERINFRYLDLADKAARYLSPQIWERLVGGEHSAKLVTQRKKLVVFFSDIKGFTELSEQMEAEGLTSVLNEYLNEMSLIALKYGGTIDKFIGDAIMIFFGDPTTEGTKKDAENCVSMAIDMKKKMRVLRQQWRSQGIKSPLEIRMGINTGYCTVGNFGTEQRLDYTIIGKEVNLASRLESNAEPGQILISYETYSHVKDKIMCQDQGEISVKGFSKPVSIFQVVDFRKDLGLKKSYLEYEAEGFSMYLDLEKMKTYEKKMILEALSTATKALEANQHIQ